MVSRLFYDTCVVFVLSHALLLVFLLALLLWFCDCALCIVTCFPPYLNTLDPSIEPARPRPVMK